MVQCKNKHFLSFLLSVYITTVGSNAPPWPDDEILAAAEIKTKTDALLRLPNPAVMSSVILRRELCGNAVRPHNNA